MNYAKQISIAILMFAGLAWGEPQELPNIDVTAELSKRAIHPGEPLYIHLRISRHDLMEENVTISIASLYNLVNVTIVDGQGHEMPIRPEEPWTDGVLGFAISKSLDSDESMSKTLIVHEWSSTAVPPGNYTAHVDLKGGRYRLESNEPMVHPTFQNPVLLPLRILKPDDEQVREIFAGMVDVTQDGSVPLADRMCAFDSLILAQGPLALPFQLDLVEAMARDRVSLVSDQRDLIKMFWYIARTSDIGTAQALAEFLERPAIQSLADGSVPDAKGIGTVIRWTIFEIYRQGKAEMQAIMQEFVDRYTEPEPFIEQRFMHGVGIRFPREY